MVKRPRSSSKRAGRLRIVAGIWRSRLLQVADVEGLRPTSERVRETLFNWLANRITGSRCLDLYAGTGALGLESLSRGAAEAVFVDRSRKAIATLRTNLAALAGDGEAERAVIEQAEARDYVGRTERKFDIIFLDPPFAGEPGAELCRLIASRGLLDDNGLIYLEQARSAPDFELPEGWTVFRSATAGNVRYALLAVGERSE